MTWGTAAAVNDALAGYGKWEMTWRPATAVDDALAGYGKWEMTWRPATAVDDARQGQATARAVAAVARAFMRADAKHRRTR